MLSRKVLATGIVAGLLIGSAVGQGPPGRDGAQVRPADHPPRAVLVGMFEPIAAGGNGPDVVIGKVLLDASASRSDRPIRWKWSGPQLILMIQPPGDGPPNSVACAYLSAPGTYRFQAIARGTADGEPDADASMFTYVIPGGPAPPPQPVQPAPQPVQPAPRPFPSQGRGPFPTSSLEAPHQPRA